MAQIYYCMKDDRLYTKIQFSMLTHCGDCLIGRLQLVENKEFQQIKNQPKRQSCQNRQFPPKPF